MFKGVVTINIIYRIAFPWIRKIVQIHYNINVFSFYIIRINKSLKRLISTSQIEFSFHCDLDFFRQISCEDGNFLRRIAEGRDEAAKGSNKNKEKDFLIRLFFIEAILLARDWDSFV